MYGLQIAFEIRTMGKDNFFGGGSDYFLSSLLIEAFARYIDLSLEFYSNAWQEMAQLCFGSQGPQISNHL